MNPTYFTLPSVRPMRDIHLVKRYVFDLNDVVGELRAALQLTDEQAELARACIIEHLREEHYLDVGLFSQTSDALRKVTQRSPRFMDALRRSLYNLFVEMAYHTCNAEFFDLTLRHDVLHVAVYD